MTDRELLPCPFCGGAAHLEEHPPHKHFLVDMPDHPGSATIECGRCEAGMIAETAEAVAAAWNRRAALSSAAVAEREPVAWVAADTLNSPHPGCVSSLAYMSQIDRERGREYVPLYAAPVAAQKADDARDAIEQRDIAIDMLARWCVAVSENGAGWDDWDEHYKDAAYRPGPLRSLLDAAIDAAMAKGGEQ